MNIHDVSLDDGSTQLWVKVDDREEFDVFDVDNAQKLIDAGIEYSEWIVTGLIIAAASHLVQKRMRNTNIR